MCIDCVMSLEDFVWFLGEGVRGMRPPAVLDEKTPRPLVGV